MLKCAYDDSILSIRTLRSKLKKLQKNPLYGPLGVFSFLALLLAVFNFWVTHKSLLTTPGVFGGPVVFATEVVRGQEDPSVNSRLAVFTGFSAPRPASAFHAESVQEIVERGWNWGKLHLRNAVDIAAPCGTPIRAFAEGIVVAEGGPKSWNEGYGGFIEIEHKDAQGKLYSTRYAHTQENIVGVSVKNYVLAGQVIALLGRTGNVHGPTGCHVHFEVRGAKNPFAR